MDLNIEENTLQNVNVPTEYNISEENMFFSKE